MRRPRVRSSPDLVLAGLNEKGRLPERYGLRVDPQVLGHVRKGQVRPKEASNWVSSSIWRKSVSRPRGTERGAGILCPPRFTSYQEASGWNGSKTSERWALSRKFCRAKIRDFLGVFHLIVSRRFLLWGKGEEVGQLGPSRDLAERGELCG